jgi:DNA-binding transcriptional LysR family regulator
MITLRQLEIFRAIAARQHVTAAAAELHLSQSAVSAALAELTERLGGPLFDRRGRRIVLNERGRRLQADAAELLQRAEELERRYRSDDAAGGRLRVGASSTIGMYLLPQLIGSFTAAHSNVQIDLEVANTGAIEAALVARTLDLGFIEGPSHHAEIEAQPWRDDELAVFVRSDDPWARKRRPTPAALAGARWVMREPGSGTREVFEAALRRLDLQVATAVTMGHSEAVKAGVRAGLGIGCLSTLALQNELATRQLVRLRVPELDLRRRLWRITRRGGYCSALQRAFVAHTAD